jgi:hypothetical protein
MFGLGGAAESIAGAVKVAGQVQRLPCSKSCSGVDANLRVPYGLVAGPAPFAGIGKLPSYGGQFGTGCSGGG